MCFFIKDKDMYCLLYYFPVPFSLFLAFFSYKIKKSIDILWTFIDIDSKRASTLDIFCTVWYSMLRYAEKESPPRMFGIALFGRSFRRVLPTKPIFSGVETESKESSSQSCFHRV